ncbi:hypothetical protein AAMO2058_001476500, partial [Amorphochlora amoebiformis]
MKEASNPGKPDVPVENAEGVPAESEEQNQWGEVVGMAEWRALHELQRSIMYFRFLQRSHGILLRSVREEHTALHK